MIIRILINLVLIIFVTIFQLAFVNNLPAWLSQFNLIIIILIFARELGSSKKIIWWFLLIGFLFDIYSPLFFGFFLIFWPVVFLFYSILSSSFFTNRSLYSFLGLTIFTTLFYYSFLHLGFYLLKVFSGGGVVFFLLVKNFYLNLLFGICLNLIAVLIIFYLINFISNKLKPVFLFKK